jgi:hypothetical protein
VVAYDLAPDQEREKGTLGFQFQRRATCLACGGDFASGLWHVGFEVRLRRIVCHRFMGD